MLPTIAIDIREATDKNPTGKGIYCLNLVQELVKSTDYNWILFDSKPQSTFNESTNIKVVVIKKSLLSFHLQVGAFLKKNQVSAYLSVTSYITPFFVPKNCSSFFFVHDLIAFKFSKGHPIKPTLIEKLFLPLIASKAKRIFTVSKSTKTDLLSFFPNLNSIKLIVTNAGFSFTKLVQSKVDQKFILSVSTFLPRKNFHTLIRAFSQIKDKYPGQLYLVGSIASKKYFNYIQNLIQSLNLQDRVVIKGYVTNMELQSLYNSADFSVYPSLYEGFGMPLLEAAASHCPVICSNTSSLPEVGGNAALYFDPTNADDLAAKMLQLYQNPNLKSDLIEKSQQNLKRFSWTKSAQIVLDEFASLK